MRTRCLLVWLVAGAALSAQDGGLPAPVETAAATITVEALRESLEFLASDALEGRDTPSPGLEKAADWLGERFRAAGLEPAFGDSWFQTGPVRPRGPGRRRPGGGSEPAPAEPPPAEAGAASPTARNVGALLRGSDPGLAADVIVFSAHYDHIGKGPPLDGDAINNGADDDATGTAAVLQIARAMAALPARPKRTTLFLCFYGEEKEFLGSRHYCESPAVPLARHRAVFNIEMVGRPDDIKPREAWITGFDQSDFGRLVAESGSRAGIRFYENGRLSKMLFSASDNISFARKGVVAHSVSAGSLHKDYHRPGDEVAKIDFPNMAAVVRGLFVAGHAMADGGSLPVWKSGSSYEEKWKALREADNGAGK